MLHKNTFKPFSVRNSLVSIPEKLTSNDVPSYIIAAIRNQSYEYLDTKLDRFCGNVGLLNLQSETEAYLWKYYFNRDIKDLRKNNRTSATEPTFILNWLSGEVVDFYKWFQRIDVFEYYIQLLHHALYESDVKDKYIAHYEQARTDFEDWIYSLNSEFERLHFAYRIVDCLFVEITSNLEIETIETAIAESQDSVQSHLKAALTHYSNRLEPDYRNAIKEAISAVEVLCRILTGENTLGKALNRLQSKGFMINETLKSAFDKLYAYTNDAHTGIRHALMDSTGDFQPTQKEALFMIVSCSAFINYLRELSSTTK